MTYMSIHTIAYEDLDNEALVDWLENQSDDGFVLITDGDESLQRDFSPEVLTLEQVLAEISNNEAVIFAEDAPTIEGFTRGVSYWGDAKLTKDAD